MKEAGGWDVGAGTEADRGIYYTLFSACRSDCVLSRSRVFLGTTATPITILLFYLMVGQVLFLSHYDSMILAANTYTTI